MESNHRLEKAKRDYLKGTKFISPLSGFEHTSTGVFRQSDYSRNIYCVIELSGIKKSICVYRGCRDHWAVITKSVKS